MIFDPALFHAICRLDVKMARQLMPEAKGLSNAGILLGMHKIRYASPDFPESLRRESETFLSYYETYSVLP